MTMMDPGALGTLMIGLDRARRNPNLEAKTSHPARTAEVDGTSSPARALLVRERGILTHMINPRSRSRTSG
jgi:hypothetical protein